MNIFHGLRKAGNKGNMYWAISICGTPHVLNSEIVDVFIDL